MKINRRGFTLAEVVVTSVTVATILTTLFVGLNRMTKAYETRNRYYSIDAMYAAMEVNDMIKRLDSTGKASFEDTLNRDGVLLTYRFFDGFQIFDELYDSAFSYDIFAYVVKNNENSLDKLKKLNENDVQFSGYVKTETLDEYIEYLKGNIDFNINYSYLVILELRNSSDINDCQYYTLKVRGDNNA